jgi:hypothetical protein
MKLDRTTSTSSAAPLDCAGTQPPGDRDKIIAGRRAGARDSVRRLRRRPACRAAQRSCATRRGADGFSARSGHAFADQPGTPLRRSRQLERSRHVGADDKMLSKSGHRPHRRLICRATCSIRSSCRAFRGSRRECAPAAVDRGMSSRVSSILWSCGRWIGRITRFAFGGQPVVNIVTVLAPAIAVQLERTPGDVAFGHTGQDRHRHW